MGLTGHPLPSLWVTALPGGCLGPEEPKSLSLDTGLPLKPPPPSPLPSHLELPHTPKQAIYSHTAMPLPMLYPFWSHALPLLSPCPQRELNPVHCLGLSSNVTFSGKAFPVLPVNKIITLPVGALSPGLTVRRPAELSQSHPHRAPVSLSIKWRQITST